MKTSLEEANNYQTGSSHIYTPNILSTDNPDRNQPENEGTGKQQDGQKHRRHQQSLME